VKTEAERRVSRQTRSVMLHAAPRPSGRGVLRSLRPGGITSTSWTNTSAKPASAISPSPPRCLMPLDHNVSAHCPADFQPFRRRLSCSAV